SHVPANLLSLGALDFGMVVDGSVVVVENVLRHIGSYRRGERTVMELIREAVHEVQRPVFFARAIIITAYLPIFTLQHVEGRLFRPMALTVSYALLGALLFSLSILPVLAVLLFGRETKEWRNPLLEAIIHGYRRSLEWSMSRSIRRLLVLGTACSLLLVAVYLMASGAIGSEFLPHLDEGAIWARGTLAPSTGPTDGERVMKQARLIF